MIERYVHLTEKQTCAVFIVAVFVGKLYAVLTYGPDYALFTDVYNQMFCTGVAPHCWTFPTTIPYSIVWYWINLFWLFPDTLAGRFWYGAYVLAFDAATTALYWQIDRIPKRYLALLQVQTIMFYLGQGSEYQNVSITAFYPLAFFTPWALLVPLLVKLPLGWAAPWDFSNVHVQCVAACTGWAMHHAWLNILMNGITNYGILIFAWEWTLEQASPRFREIVKFIRDTFVSRLKKLAC